MSSNSYNFPSSRKCLRFFLIQCSASRCRNVRRIQIIKNISDILIFSSGIRRKVVPFLLKVVWLLFWSSICLPLGLSLWIPFLNFNFLSTYLSTIGFLGKSSLIQITEASIQFAYSEHSEFLCLNRTFTENSS